MIWLFVTSQRLKFIRYTLILFNALNIKYSTFDKFSKKNYIFPL